MHESGWEGGAHTDAGAIKVWHGPGWVLPVWRRPCWACPEYIAIGKSGAGGALFVYRCVRQVWGRCEARTGVARPALLRHPGRVAGCPLVCL
jgi:hypothetical protein